MTAALVPDLLPTDLLGTWTLDREIDDRLGGEVRHVAGSAQLSRLTEDHVRWTEQGVMTWSGGTVEVGRTLDVVRRDDGRWWVLFSDGRDFHPWSVGSPVDHPCGADHYRGLVTGDAESWTVTWETTGPHKDYVMVTRHSDRR